MEKKIPQPPKSKPPQGQETIDELVSTLRSWVKYQLAHIRKHSLIVTNLNEQGIDQDQFERLSVAIYLSEIQLRYCKKNIERVQDKIQARLPVTDAGISNFSVLNNYITEKPIDKTPIPIPVQ